MGLNLYSQKPVGGLERAQESPSLSAKIENGHQLLHLAFRKFLHFLSKIQKSRCLDNYLYMFNFLFYMLLSLVLPNLYIIY